MPIPTAEDLKAAETYAERGRTTSARWYVVHGEVWHSRAPGHIVPSIHTVERIRIEWRLERVAK